MATKKEAAPKKTSAAKANKESAPKKEAEKKSAAEEKPANDNAFPQWLPGAMLIVAVILIGAVLLFLNMGSLSKSAIERIASHTLKVPVTIGSLDFSLEEKRATLSGLKIGNPAGFKNRHALTADVIDVALESVSEQRVVFRHIIVNGAQVFLEVEPSGTNLSAIHKSMDLKAPPQAESIEAKKPMKVVVRDLQINNAKLLSSSSLVQKDLEPIEMPDIGMSIGKDGDGVISSRAIGEVLTAVARVATYEAGRSGYLEGLSVEQIKQMKGELGIDGMMNSIRNQFQKVFGR